MRPRGSRADHQQRRLADADADAADADDAMQFVRNLRRALTCLAAAGSAAAAATLASSRAGRAAQPDEARLGDGRAADSITEVVITARPVSQHIEEQQRELADSYADFSGDCLQEGAARCARRSSCRRRALAAVDALPPRAIKGLEGAPSSMQ